MSWLRTDHSAETDVNIWCDVAVNARNYHNDDYSESECVEFDYAPPDKTQVISEANTPRESCTSPTQ